MAQSRVYDTAVHQWSADLDAMAELVPEEYRDRLKTKAKIQDPVTGTLVPTLPWYGAYWNEDSPDYDRPDDGSYTKSETYRSPSKMRAELDDMDVDKAILSGHELRFLSALEDPHYTASLASAWNEHLANAWLPESDRYKGSILVAMNNPKRAVKEIEKYADNPDMVTVLVPGGQKSVIGDEQYDPVYEAAVEADLPVTVHSSGNPVNKQTAGGIPELFEVFETSVAQNHMVNMNSMIFQQTFDKFPDLEVVWAGQGVGWFLHPMWRGVRVYRNQFENSPDLKKDPEEYVQEHCYFTTHPLGNYSERNLELLFELVGPERVLYASGYPDWNYDETDILDSLSESDREKVLWKNAEQIYGT
jgi:predicted TIM-barrel fold metal-dependent hydrolase